MNLSRRAFTAGLGAAGASSLLPRAARAARENELNILCWEGYNTDDVLGPFRDLHPGATVRAESGTSDPDMINKLRAGEVNVWDLINLNQPWARGQLMPEGLIKPLNKERFLPYFEKMAPEFSNPTYPLAFSPADELIGMPQRYGPFSFVVNTDVISRELAEDEGWKIFLDPAMAGRYGVLTYDNWNLMHMCITGDLNPFEPLDEAGFARFDEVARTIFAGAKLLTDDLVAMNTALINGEIDAYFTGGTYTASPARLDGLTNVRAITPRSGPINGKGGVVWIELTSVVNNPQGSPLAEDFLEFVQKPEICKAVGFAEGTYNPVAQMGDPEVFALWDEDELDAIQWDSLEEEMANSVEYDVVTDYDKLMELYTAARRA
ncbi:twin-arginine translocation pathway signal [Citreicella sp. SE45]|uniref:Spermidine/putrescine transport system substrate-binding protein n=2 Tax=Salipiger TaxID=263377 RepID=A0A1G7DD46_9RHOB|nr:PotD/PotF family extracellular solute-binding protein [Salipiger thiooxidans]EEX15950.1 twin-arginine translocation pathway signal [Citreicella sp. SE45]MAU45652.1 spermidine/putrescine ABC transporter substrate-binding protein [Salipiger sp.]MAZ29246.1 spermidine/putrescine ABC transporter substrate-binding protein [Cytophagaceae bacterium]SDE49389.1 spermidine/putrescine transport system substrate-binding protein [Salipiger thiooxidans]